LANNPALDIETIRRCPSCGRGLGAAEICPVCSVKRTSDNSDTIVFLSPLRDFSSDYAMPRQTNDDENLEFEDFQAGELSLGDYLLYQLKTESTSIQFRIAEHLVSSLDEKGFLTIPLSEVARFFHVPVEDVVEVKQMIQSCDPIGVGSENSIEAMQIQLEALAETQDIPALVKELVANYMEDLLHRKYEDIIMETGATMDEIIEATEFIAANLTPFPANAVYGNVRIPVEDTGAAYHQPDAIIRFLNNDPNNGLSVEVVMPYVNQIFVNPGFKKAIADAPEVKREKWEEDYNRASLLVKCLQQRAVTIVRLIQYLVDFQKEFILKGEKHLIPLTRAKVSQILDVHESTISRAVAKKTIQFPDGKIVPLSAFFSRNMSVRCALKEIVAHENQPLSDSKIVIALQKRGYNVARRTVAKYRMMEGILPAHLRKLGTDEQPTTEFAIHSAAW
jgi:RNA polymerase sigma-54 factor